VAAGSLLVTEAGGLVGNFSGDGGDLLEQGEHLAAPPRIYAQMVTLLAPYSRFKSEHAGTAAPERTPTERGGKPLSLRRSEQSPASGETGTPEQALSAAVRAAEHGS
jgi:myo-inositol-1(or 4)-monophosphatase